MPPTNSWALLKNIMKQFKQILESRAWFVHESRLYTCFLFLPDNHQGFPGDFTQMLMTAPYWFSTKFVIVVLDHLELGWGWFGIFSVLVKRGHYRRKRLELLPLVLLRCRFKWCQPCQSHWFSVDTDLGWIMSFTLGACIAHASYPHMIWYHQSVIVAIQK